MISLTLAASLLKGAINLQLCAELTRVVVLVATLRGYNRLCKCFTEYCGQWVCMNCRGLIRFIGGKSVVVWSFCTQHIVLALFPASLPPCLLCFVLWFFINYFTGHGFTSGGQESVCVRCSCLQNTGKEGLH